MTSFTLNLHGRLVEYTRPVVMGVLNSTPDSFYSASRAQDYDSIKATASRLVSEGADMLDLGACSTRPGADMPDADTEWQRLSMAIKAIREAVGEEIPLSVDTFRADVAHKAIEAGADIINDISGGDLDTDMFDTVATLGVPYILTHMRGTPADMHTHTDYDDVVADVIGELSHKISRLEELGAADIIVDPGFGFAKTLDQNYRMLSHLGDFAILGRPVLAGMSRKSMLTRLLNIDAADALIPTAIAGTLALERGASILRVHDPMPAMQSIKILQQIQ